ncbi:MAG: tRNA pseudouridine(55) synthase TruB [Blastochloris viridis]|uniref:tRNA pseudouridine synthase B n=1 Tax=Blastochloris viridis TaxID=1079 RepID=A0A6N4RF64_BLAVI|nr:MAG: tRNA pseudouridine(55) synthase TruB [Blastochloris viridis]
MPQLPQPATTVHGFYVVYKPVGPSSAGITNRLKWLLKKECGQPKGVKIGHGGTLDPLADGLLPIGVGKATKQLQALLEGPKTYTFTLKFGSQTTTDDTEGEVVARSDIRPTEAELSAILPQFTGDISQQPPIFSALKIDGQRAYKLAREGAEVQLEPRRITIHNLKVLTFSPESALLEAEVSKGTYIRALARDIALALGTVGYVTTLTRIKHGPFGAEQAVTYEMLDKALQSGDTHSYLLPLAVPPEQAD